MFSTSLKSDEIKSWKFYLNYHGKLKKLDIGRMSYLCYIKQNRKYFYMEQEPYYTDETGVNEALIEWYPIKKTAKSCWHIHKMNLVNMGLLDDGYVICSKAGDRGAVILNNDFDKMYMDNEKEFERCEQYLNLIATNYSSYKGNCFHKNGQKFTSNCIEQ